MTPRATPSAGRLPPALEVEVDDWFARSLLPISVLALDGTHLFVNDAVCRLMSQTRDALMRTPVASLCCSPEDRRIVDDVMSAARAGRRGGVVTFELHVSPERVMTVQLTWTLASDRDGEPWYVTATYADQAAPVATLGHPEEEIAASRARFEQSSQPQATIDVHARLSAVNPALCALVGRPAEDLVDLDHKQDDYFEGLARLAGDVVIVGSATGELVYVSPAAERVLGYTQEELTGAIGWDFVHPDDLPVAAKRYADVVSAGGTSQFRLRVRRGDGTWRWLEETITNQLHGAVGGIVCNLRDVHEQIQADMSLRESEARFRAIAETASEGIWLVSPQGQTLFANCRMAAMLGVPLSRVYSDPATSLVDPAAARTMTDRLTTRAVLGDEQYEVDVVDPTGRRLRFAVAASPLPGPDGDIVGSLAMVSDVTEARLAERELRRAALHDALTGLPNRGLFLDRLEQALRRNAGRTAVFFLDLDRFKLVNDYRGHDVGDQLLVAVAARLSASARRQDTVARFGGDEFVVLAEDMDEGAAERLGLQLREGLASPLAVDGVAWHVDASIGIALSPPASAADLLRYADTAMHEAKAAGRGRVRLFDPALAEAAAERYILADRLRSALGEDALSMEYQPIVCLQTGQVIGIEALARWTDPDYGTVAPDRFVSIAESNGLAPLLDRWALTSALRDARVLLRAGAIPVDAYVSVNLSASNASDRGLEDFIVTSTTASGLAPANVMLEITEGAIMSDADVAIPLLRRLRARGFLLAIDDFGTGQSSLAYLRDLPVNYLKIDRSFIAGVREDSDALAVAHSVIDLGRAVGMTVIAEGVEERHQAMLLQQLGCHAAQGWLWSTSLPVSDIVASRTWATRYDVGTAEDLQPSARRPGRPRVRSEHGLDRILAMHQKGASLSTIAAALNSDGYLTPAGLRWHHASVARAVSDAATPSLVVAPPRDVV